MITMNRLRAPQFSTMSPMVRQTPPAFNHRTDSLLFCHEHGHTHGPNCDHAHGENTQPNHEHGHNHSHAETDHHTPEHGHVHGPSCNHSHGHSTQDTHKPSTAHVHANGTTCHENHDDQPNVKKSPTTDPEKKGFSKALHAVRTWFSHFFETFKNDMLALKDKIIAFFSRKTEPQTKQG